MIKQNILIVDDHRENLVALEAVLDAPGRNLIMASSGEEALRLALKHDLALILLDVQMPEMDGFEVATLLRNSRKTRAVPIIFVTAISREDDYVFRGYECGAVDFLLKPVNHLILSAKVETFLELDLQRRRLQQAVVQMKRLKDENERLLQAIGDAVLGVNADGDITFCNDVVAWMLGGTRADFTGRGIDGQFWRDAALSQPWSFADSELVAACREGRPWQGTTPLYMKRDDDVRVLDVSANAVGAAGEEFTGVVMVVRDITGQTQAAAGRVRDGRRFPRKRVYRELVLFDRTTGGNVGRLLNLSEDGFKLFTRQDIEEGDLLQFSMILPEQIQGVNTLSFDARNIWRQEQETPGEYHLGFQFQDITDDKRNIIRTLLEKL